MDKWVRGLPGGLDTTIISLLGRKPDGQSEFSFYSFCGEFETDAERGSRPTFEQWLKQRFADRGIQVIEHPTIDFKPIPAETLGTVSREIDAQLSSGRTVVVVDSGGETRTRQVFKFAGFLEDSRAC